MTLVMAEKTQPLFRDFLGLGHTDEVKQVRYTSSDVIPVSRTSPEFDSEGDGETTATRASSGKIGHFKTSSVPGGLASPSICLALPSSSDPGSVGWQQAQTASIQHHGNRSAFYKLDVESPKTAKKRDSPPNRDTLQERLVEVLECSPRSQKVARHEYGRPEKRSEPGELVPTSDDLRLSMQPPRASNKSPPWFQQTTKPETPRRHTKKLEHARPTQINPGVAMRGLSHLGACAERAEKASATISRENITSCSPQLAQPAADEGSRTGLKGSILAGLLDSAGLLHDPSNPTPAGSSGGPPPSGRQQKMPSWNTGSDSIPPSSREAPPASRQLTIFYGGQAHVFDDVPPDRADAIMALAGSNGRSWSTTYSPQPNARATNSFSDGSLSALEREKDKSVQSRGSLAVSSEAQTLLCRLSQNDVNGLTLADFQQLPAGTKIFTAQICDGEATSGLEAYQRKQSDQST